MEIWDGDGTKKRFIIHVGLERCLVSTQLLQPCSFEAIPMPCFSTTVQYRSIYLTALVAVPDFEPINLLQ